MILSTRSIYYTKWGTECLKTRLSGFLCYARNTTRNWKKKHKKQKIYYSIYLSCHQNKLINLKTWINFTPARNTQCCQIYIVTSNLKIHCTFIQTQTISILIISIQIASDGNKHWFFIPQNWGTGDPAVVGIGHTNAFTFERLFAPR